MSDLKGSYAKKGEKLDFKIIYGVEAYLVDDTKQIVTNQEDRALTIHMLCSTLSNRIFCGS